MTTVAKPATLPSDDLPPDTPRVLTTRTLDDGLCLMGAALGAVALVSVLYGHVLPFSGVVGYVICLFVTYLAFVAGLSALSNPRPVVVDRVAAALVYGAASLVGLALLSTIVYTVVKGWSALHHVNFFTKDMAGVSPQAPFTEGGILHALVGTLEMVGIAVVISLPLGIGTAVYMSEVRGKFSRIVRTVIEAMTALPDIIAGLFIYTLFIVRFGLPSSGFAAALALTVMMLPIIARAADVQLRVVPGGLREAGLALGASQWQTIWRVVLPTARSGLATALILGVARAVGETAPIILTSGASTYFTANPFHIMNSLPLFIYTAVRSGEVTFAERGYAAAVVLLAIVLFLFVLARLIARPRKGSR